MLKDITCPYCFHFVGIYSLHTPWNLAFAHTLLKCPSNCHQWPSNYQVLEMLFSPYPNRAFCSIWRLTISSLIFSSKSILFLVCSMSSMQVLLFLSQALGTRRYLYLNLFFLILSGWSYPWPQLLLPLKTVLTTKSIRWLNSGCIPKHKTCTPNLLLHICPWVWSRHLKLNMSKLNYHPTSKICCSPVIPIWGYVSIVIPVT